MPSGNLYGSNAAQVFESSAFDPTDRLYGTHEGTETRVAYKILVVNDGVYHALKDLLRILGMFSGRGKNPYVEDSIMPSQYGSYPKLSKISRKVRRSMAKTPSKSRSKLISRIDAVAVASTFLGIGVLTWSHISEVWDQ
ncbi:hypothetical protein J4E85_011050 [Alternaria conjuncta]|uniref:uncharacterized protein n=1 Tax=Alternaria conjuncta TaxID=181017 RepID=UPI00221F8BF8|nr:uncharacterized protein J4E85_011050 [Alternaria conjuncta]KAI4912317.1 hypothetical protein J4E85_011050 [Alternaria conjuncta]